MTSRARSSTGWSHGRPCCCSAASPRSPTGSTRRCKPTTRAPRRRARATIPTCTSRTSAPSASTPTGASASRSRRSARRALIRTTTASTSSSPSLALTDPGKPRLTIAADARHVVGRSRDRSRSAATCARRATRCQTTRARERRRRDGPVNVHDRHRCASCRRTDAPKPIGPVTIEEPRGIIHARRDGSRQRRAHDSSSSPASAARCQPDIAPK